MTTPIYQYHVRTWGGFYNEEYKTIHGLTGGDFIFETKTSRSEFINERRGIEKTLGARHLMFRLSEGFCCDVRTVLHRVIRFEGKEYYSSHDCGVNCPFSLAKYYLEYKWYLGCNDYPLGYEFDYDDPKIETLAEWVTGAFQDLDDE